MNSNISKETSSLGIKFSIFTNVDYYLDHEMVDDSSVNG